MTLRNICLTSPFSFLQPLGFPGDDLTAVPWQRPRCNEGPVLLHFSAHLPAPLSVLQDLCSAVLPVRRPRLLAGIDADIRAAVQTSALLPADGASPHRQHAAAEAQLALPEPQRLVRWTPGARRSSEGLRSVASGNKQPAPGAVRRPRRRRDGGGDQHGEPGLRRRWDYRL